MSSSVSRFSPRPLCGGARALAGGPGGVATSRRVLRVQPEEKVEGGAARCEPACSAQLAGLPRRLVEVTAPHPARIQLAERWTKRIHRQ